MTTKKANGKKVNGNGWKKSVIKNADSLDTSSEKKKQIIEAVNELKLEDFNTPFEGKAGWHLFFVIMYQSKSPISVADYIKTSKRKSATVKMEISSFKRTLICPYLIFDDNGNISLNDNAKKLPVGLLIKLHTKSFQIITKK